MTLDVREPGSHHEYIDGISRTGGFAVGWQPSVSPGNRLTYTTEATKLWHSKSG